MNNTFVTINGAKHKITSEFDYHKAKMLPLEKGRHPIFGQIYVDKNGMGYCASGFNWMQFKLNELDTIIKNYID